MIYDFNINDRAFNAIKNRTKKVEIRATGLDYNCFDYGLVQEDDLINFTANNGEKIKVKVLGVNHYRTVEELLTLEGTQYTLSSTNDYKEGVKSIKSIQGYEEAIKKNGVYAIHIRII